VYAAVSTREWPRNLDKTSDESGPGVHYKATRAHRSARLNCHLQLEEYCDHASLLVPSFAGTDVQHLRQISLLTLQRSRSKCKVKTAVLNIFQSLQLDPGLRYVHQILQSDWDTGRILSRNMTVESTKYTRWRSVGSLQSLECFLV